MLYHLPPLTLGVISNIGKSNYTNNHVLWKMCNTLYIYHSILHHTWQIEHEGNIIHIYIQNWKCMCREISESHWSSSTKLHFILCYIVYHIICLKYIYVDPFDMKSNSLFLCQIYDIKFFENDVWYIIVYQVVYTILSVWNAQAWGGWIFNFM